MHSDNISLTSGLHHLMSSSPYISLYNNHVWFYNVNALFYKPTLTFGLNHLMSSSPYLSLYNNHVCFYNVNALFYKPTLLIQIAKSVV